MSVARFRTMPILPWGQTGKPLARFPRRNYPMTRIQGVVVIAGLCLVFAAAGCGGSSISSGDESEATTSTTIGGAQVESHGTKDVSSESGKVEIELYDNYF